STLRSCRPTPTRIHSDAGTSARGGAMSTVSEPAGRVPPRLATSAPRAGTPGGRLSVGRRPSRFWRIREDLPQGQRALYATISVAAPLLAWVTLAATGAVNPIFLPTPLDVAAAGRDLLAEGLLHTDAVASLQRIAIGFGLSLLISIPLG